MKRIVVLGTFHMRPTTDMFGVKLDDLQTPKRQAEILEVVERVKKFQPTKVALEVPTKNNDHINQEFRDYLAGKFELKVNEVHQVGFRIAADLGHEQVYCIDWMEQGAGTKGAGDVYEYAKENQPELFESIFGWLSGAVQSDSGFKPEYKTILDLYRECNDRAEVKKHHTMNINMARIGEIDNYFGMEWLIWWYQRNLILFSNLARIATEEDDRILLLIGSGHVQILEQFLNESGLFGVEHAIDYL